MNYQGMLSWFGKQVITGVMLAAAGFTASAQELQEGRIVIPLRDPQSILNRDRIDPQDAERVRTLPDSIASPLVDKAMLEDFREYFRDQAAGYRIPGYAFVLVQDDSVLMEDLWGVRDIRSSEPITAETVFNIGPATQAFTSLLAAVMQYQKLVEWDKPAHRIYPAFRLSAPQNTQEATLRHLLSMSVGLPEYTDNILDPAWALPEDILTVSAQAPLVGRPGERFKHSLVSVSAAGYLLAYANDPMTNPYQGYLDHAETYLLTPLGMEHTTFSPRQAAKGARAGHHHQQGHFEIRRSWEPEINPFAPAVGLKSTLRDLEKWLFFEIAEGRTPDGTRLADAHDIRERWQPATVRESQHYGMGWTRQYHQRVEIIAAAGSYDGQSAIIGLLPAYRAGFALLINAEGDFASKLMTEAALSLAELYQQLR